MESPKKLRRSWLLSVGVLVTSLLLVAFHFGVLRNSRLQALANGKLRFSLIIDPWVTQSRAQHYH